MASKTQILSLYKSLLRESEKFTNYNFRFYALRRIRDAFKANKNINDQKLINKEIEFANENLAMIRRQAAIGNMYKTEKLVIENVVGPCEGPTGEVPPACLFLPCILQNSDLSL